MPLLKGERGRGRGIWRKHWSVTTLDNGEENWSDFFIPYFGGGVKFIQN